LVNGAAIWLPIELPGALFSRLGRPLIRGLWKPKRERRKFRMTELAPGWDIVSRRTNNRLRGLLAMALQMALTAEQGIYSSVTWTIRQTSTGAIRKVTARSEARAREKIAQNLLDPD
jgi:hypothetical protein